MNRAEREGLVTVKREGRGIESLQLTQEGAEFVRNARPNRPLHAGKVYRS